MKKNLKIILTGILLIGSPLLGIFISGKPVDKYLQFPPRTQFIQHADFSWLAFIIIAFLILITLVPFIYKILRTPHETQVADKKNHNFPWWGWLGLIIGILFWILAWNRFSWFSFFQSHTFTPLWLSYIVVINALTFKRIGKSSLTHQPVFLLVLFLASAVFWWFFEYLNRFVQNWYYVEVAHIDRFEYIWRASLSFSTVLPAVYSTRQWLGTFPLLSRGLQAFVKVRLSAKIEKIILCLAVLPLLFIGVWPDYLFPFLWVSPLVILLFLLIDKNQQIWLDLKKGDWSQFWSWSLAALVCGFFWEMWNSASLAKWVYALPFVHQFQLFEMPILGYAGYLTFGLECAVITAINREVVKKLHPARY